MAKRIADSQITRETFKDGGSDSDGANGGSSNHGVASASVMSKRKIAIPKKKAAGRFSFQKQSDGGGNVFSIASSESQISNNLDSLRQTHSPATETDANDTNAKVKALNLQFKEKVVELLAKDAFVDLRPALDKYSQYIEPLKREGKSALSAVKQPAKSADTKTEESLSEGEKNIVAEGPKFTVQSKPPTSDSVFSFGTQKQEKKRSNDTDSEDEIEIKGPQFTFNGQVKSDIFKLDKAAKEKKEKPSVVNPFTIKSSDSVSVNSAEPSAFNSGSSNAGNTKPIFKFGQANTENEQSKKPSFDFSFKPNNVVATDKGENKSSFSFKLSEQNPPQDTQSDKPKPVFSFGAPRFDTNGEKNSNAKTAFSFGSSNSTVAPSFSFTKPNNNDTATATTTTTTEHSSATPGAFKFSLPFSQKPASQATPSLPIVTTTANEKELKPEDSNEEPSKPMDMQNGEENEDSLFSQKSKLMTFDSATKAYDSRGVGELKLLQRKDDKSKVRLLCRSDGMGNILLNTSLVKSFTYSPLTPESDNLIKIPAVGAEGKLVTYVAKFKQKADGRLFVKSIEDVKKDM